MGPLLLSQTQAWPRQPAANEPIGTVLASWLQERMPQGANLESAATLQLSPSRGAPGLSVQPGHQAEEDDGEEGWPGAKEFIAEY